MKVTFKDIVVHVNRKKYENVKGKKKTNWISVGNIVYLSYIDGRVYFSLNKKNDIIKNIKLNDERLTFSFKYEGPWDDKEVKYNFRVVFDKKRDYEKFKVIYNKN